MFETIRLLHLTMVQDDIKPTETILQSVLSQVLSRQSYQPILLPAADRIRDTPID